MSIPLDNSNPRVHSGCINQKTYLEYKQRGTDALKACAKEIASLSEEEADEEEKDS